MDGSARNEQRFPDGRIVALSAAGRLGLQRQERLLDVGEVRLDGLFSYAVFMTCVPAPRRSRWRCRRISEDGVSPRGWNRSGRTSPSGRRRSGQAGSYSTGRKKFLATYLPTFFPITTPSTSAVRVWMPAKTRASMISLLMSSVLVKVLVVPVTTLVMVKLIFFVPKNCRSVSEKLAHVAQCVET
jgi:hypothetical protein